MIKKDLTEYKNLFKEYAELRIQENRQTQIVLVNGNIMENTYSTNSGVSVRVFNKGNWGFASKPVITDEAIRSAYEVASRNANFLGERVSKKGIKLPSRPAKMENTFFTSSESISQKDKIEFLKKIDSYLNDKYPDLSSKTLVINSLDMEKNLITSDGASSYSMIPRSMVYIVLSKSVNGENFELIEPFGARGQFEDIFTNPEKLYPNIDRQYQRLVDKTDGILATAGIKDVILDADLAGILAHEAIGHTTEADLVLGGSVAGDKLNQLVASPLISLVDFANTAMNETCPVPVYVDDEGVQSVDTTIIENGILMNYMHNKESADHFNVAPTGNARAFDFSDEPLIRMRNTAILPGSSKLKDMIASIDDGYYLIKSSNGQADSTSEFMFGIVLGYEIKNGQLGKAIRDTTISGIAFDVLKSVSMVSDDMSWSCDGMCGKKQFIPVGMGGPAIKCKVNIGGK